MVSHATLTGARARRWLLGGLSAWIVWHFMAILGTALGARSGPWPVNGELGWATPPQFAQEINSLCGSYLWALNLTSDYHFPSDRPQLASRFEVRLRDAQGNELEVVQIPDPSANAFVRHRQSLLADGLAADMAVEAPPGEFVPAPNQPVRTVVYWNFEGGPIGALRTIEEHLIPRDQQVTGPTDWALLLARSYSRYLCRTHGAASAEIVRHTKDAIPPDVLFADSPPQAAAFDSAAASFGVFHAQVQQ
jgi:hypothetical protein